MIAWHSQPRIVIVGAATAWASLQPSGEDYMRENFQPRMDEHATDVC